MKYLLRFLVLAALVLTPLAAAAAPSPGTKTDRLILSPQASAPGCPSGQTCLYSRSSDNQIYDVDASGAVLRIHDAKAFRSAANCSALASPQNGDICYDTGSSLFRYYSGGWTSASTDDALLVHKAGTETVTGAKTFGAAVTLTGGATLGANLAGGGFKGTGFAVGTASGQLLTADRQVLTSAPITGGGNLAGDLTLGLSVSAPLSVFGGSLIISPGGLVYAQVTGNGAGALGAGTVYLSAPAALPSATEVTLSKAVRAGSLGKLFCDLGVAPGGASTVTFTARAAAADTSLTCTITGASTSCSDTSHTPAVSAGQRLSVKAVSSGAVAADASCGFEETN